MDLDENTLNHVNHDNLQCVVDYTSSFTTHEMFNGKDAMIKWAREVARMNGFVLVIKRSTMTERRRQPQLTLACEQSGKYRKFVKANHDVPENKRRKRIATKKCDCPFTLRGQRVSNQDEWMLRVVYGVHNHSEAKNMEGHSFIGRLSIEESNLVVDMSTSMVRPKDILATIKQKDPNNCSTMRTVYNARVKERACRSQMQELLGKLKESNYLEWHRRIVDIVRDLFFAHPTSVDLLRTFPEVVIMDCTYKTNRYRLPLLEIVGITSTNMTFSIAFAYLEVEREENYIWALSRLRELMNESEMPRCFVTDQELGLMNAVSTVFLTAQQLLCRWHIGKNVLARCKKLFNAADWEKFSSCWSNLTCSKDESRYVQNLVAMEQDFSSFPQSLSYIKETWLDNHKEMFVSAWTDNYRHFGCTTSNR